MQTTPPIVMASAPKAGAVQPWTRKIAAVAISVAIVIPETGLAEEPTRPDNARTDRHEEKSEDDDQQRSGKIGRPSYKGSGHRLELEKDEHASDDEQRADENNAHG